MNMCICGNLTKGKYCSIGCGNKARAIQNTNRYNEHPRLCKQCKYPLHYRTESRQKFCSRSCAATYNNAHFPKRKKLYTQTSKQDWIDHITKERRVKVESGNTNNRDTLKRYLKDTRGDVCEKCHQPGVWEGELLTLVLDHIDGDPGRSTPDNIRLLCPNCNSQTPTFSGRNKGNGRKSRGLPR